jgi:hypothetical protein
MGAKVADFEQFSDVSFDLRLGGDIDKTLTKNLDATPYSGEGALLMWNVRREGSGSVSYEVKVNNGSIATYTVNQGDWSSVHEAMPTSSIHLGDNTVEFRVTTGTGTLSIGDVILFYRQDT